MTASARTTPVERKLGKTLAHRPWDPIPRALKHFRKRLNYTKHEVYFLEQLIQLAGLGDTFLATIRFLAHHCDEPKSTVYGYVRSLQRKGALTVTQDVTPWGARGKTRISLAPLKAQLIELVVAEQWDAEAAEEEDASVRTAIDSASESGQNVRTVTHCDRKAPTHGRDSVDSPENHVDPGVSSPTFQLKAIARSHAKRLRVPKGQACRDFERQVLDFVDRHDLDRRTFERLAAAVARDRKIATADAFWAGLDRLQAAIVRKDGAA